MVGILNCYHQQTAVADNADLHDELMLKFVQSIAGERPVRVYNVAMGEWPDHSADLWVITGSLNGAYDNESWIHKLCDFIRNQHQQKNKMLGICFGHQIIAQALGGEVVRNDKGWGWGIKEYPVEMPSWSKVDADKIQLYFVHQDHVLKPPSEAQVLSGNDFCPVQMMQIGDHILSFQGHPEFSRSFVELRLNLMKDKLPQETYQKALESLDLKTTECLAKDWVKELLKL